MLAFIPEAMECVERRSRDHTRWSVLSGEAAITPEPMECVERRSRDHTDAAAQTCAAGQIQSPSRATVLRLRRPSHRTCTAEVSFPT